MGKDRPPIDVTPIDNGVRRVGVVTRTANFRRAGEAFTGGIALARSLDELCSRNPQKADDLAHMLAAIAGECEAADEIPESIDVTFHDGNGFDVRLSDVREVRRGR